MADYKLYYWSVPFRGQFVRAVLAFAGKTWTEGGDDAIGKLMEGSVKKMPVPFMGPPVLVDNNANFAISQCLLSSFTSANPWTCTPPIPAYGH
jgi:glutathione S-transferase